MEGSIHWAQLPLFPLGRLSVVLLCEGEVSVYAALDACFSVLSCEGLHGKRLYQDSHSQSNTITGVQGDWWSPTDLLITANTFEISKNISSSMNLLSLNKFWT